MGHDSNKTYGGVKASAEIFKMHSNALVIYLRTGVVHSQRVHFRILFPRRNQPI
jgi:hypothetical protein